MNYAIGVDVGTTSTKAVLYDEHARDRPVYQGYPLPGQQRDGRAGSGKMVAAVEHVIHDAGQQIDFAKENC